MLIITTHTHVYKYTHTHLCESKLTWIKRMKVKLIHENWNYILLITKLIFIIFLVKKISKHSLSVVKGSQDMLSNMFVCIYPQMIFLLDILEHNINVSIFIIWTYFCWYFIHYSFAFVLYSYFIYISVNISFNVSFNIAEICPLDLQFL